MVPVTFATRRLSFDVRGLLGLDHPWVRILKQIQAAKKLSEKDAECKPSEFVKHISIVCNQLVEIIGK